MAAMTRIFGSSGQVGLGLADRMVPKWKIEAASTALAWPSRTPSTRWSSVPTPPEAITGTAPHRRSRASAQVVAGLGAVAVHGGEQDFARAQRHDLPREFDRVDARWACARHG